MNVKAIRPCLRLFSHCRFQHRVVTTITMTFDSRTMSGSSSSRRTTQPPDVRFSVSQVPRNPLGEGNYIKSAAALIIGCVVCRDS